MKCTLGEEQVERELMNEAEFLIETTRNSRHRKWRYILWQRVPLEDFWARVPIATADGFPTEKLAVEMAREKVRGLHAGEQRLAGVRFTA